MRLEKTIKKLCSLRIGICFFLLLPALEVRAESFSVSNTTQLTAAIGKAKNDDSILLAAGLYEGNFVLSHSVALLGQGNVRLGSRGEGTILTINAPNVIVRGLHFRDSGHDITEQDACILVNPTGYSSKVSDNILENCGWGVWVERASDVTISHNTITGSTERIVSDRGNGIHLFNVAGGMVVGNRIRQGRDGVYISNSRAVSILDNDITDLRFGIHYMYSDACTVSGNSVSRATIGAALMYSKYLVVDGNTLHYNEQHGILMRDILYSDVRNNLSNHNRDGLYLGSSYFNRISGNTFLGNDIAAEVSNGSKDNHVSRNRFMDNRLPVKFMDKKSIDWSDNGVGNYWSAYSGWDRDGDGVGDQPYVVTRIVDRLLYQYPVLKLVFRSPAFQLLAKIENSFPVLRGAAIIDSAPLMESN